MYKCAERANHGELTLTDHSADGIAILTSQPSWLTRATLYALLCLLLAGLTWSFFGHADVIVQAQGRLGPETKERLVYTPIKGQLVDLYIAEGMPVTKGDTLARLNAIGAIQIASQALNARLKLQEVETNYRNFPLQKESLEHFINTLEVRLDNTKQAYELRLAEGMEKLAEEQRINLEKARLKLASAKEALTFAETIWKKHQRLFDSPGGGGISRATVEEKRKEYQTKLGEYEIAKNELAEFEVKMNKEYAKKQQDMTVMTEDVMSLYAQIAQKKAALADSETQIQAQLRMARAEAAAMAKITFDDIDQDNLLRIKAPVSGVITSVDTAQPGAEIEPKTPLFGIAPSNARTVLHIEIQESERAFLREGMPVKMKFNAFPYQRYGFISGTLEYIAPNVSFSTNSTEQKRVLIYKGRVSLDRDHFTISDNNTRVPLRHGMTAIAEIVVRQRRLIDLALDPLRRVAG